MKILLTGASGYIGKQLLPVLVRDGHKVVCCVRDINRFTIHESLKENIEIIEVDFLNKASLEKIPKDIDAAYYLIHSMASSNDYATLELKSARYFKEVIRQTRVRHIIYLSGIVNEETLSKHLASRSDVETELAKGSYPFTTLRAGIIIGSGSASFEIIRDLVEKLPVMVAPKWLLTKCQPISILDVVEFLNKSLMNELTFNRSYDIGGPEVLNYKEMLLGYSKVRGLKRRIYIIPVLTPKISSFWLYFITSTSYKLATALVSSMKVEVVCRNDEINHLLNIWPISYGESVQKAFSVLKNNPVISAWNEVGKINQINQNLADFIKVPINGCFIDFRTKEILNYDKTSRKFWDIIDGKSWICSKWQSKLNIFTDKLLTARKLERGRIDYNNFSNNYEFDSWWILYENRSEGRIVLYNKTKKLGEVWLEYIMMKNQLNQSFIFRPLGVSGRMYWYLKYPLHKLILKGFINQLSG